MLALWTLSILSVFAITTGYQVRQRITLADRIDLRSWLHGIAEAGVDQAIAELKKIDPTGGYDPLTDWASNPKVFRHAPAADGNFTVSYDVLDSDGTVKTRYGPRDEESKINLNSADARVISKVLQMGAGLDEDKANEIAFSVMDWRDSDSFLSDPNFDAEDSYYEDLKIPYGAKDRPFEVLAELLLVRGMTPEIFEKVKGKVTIYGAKAVNINTAAKETLMALGLEEQLADKIITYRKGTDREEPSADDRAFTDPGSIVTALAKEQLSGADQAVLNDLAAKGLLSVLSSVFHIHSAGALPGKKMALEIDTVVDRKGKILFWSAGIPRRMSAEEIKSIETEEAAAQEEAA